MPDWVADNESIFWVIGVASVVVFFASLLVMPLLLARIPADYFAHEQRPPSRWAHHKSALRLAILIIRNCLGLTVILAGVAMLMLPGQGLLTIVAGLVIMDFPGKYAFERWLVRKRLVYNPINWIRRKRGVAPLRVFEPHIPGEDAEP